jgi:hypothetical protein
MPVRFCLINVASLVLFLSLPISAHHSHGNYQMTEYTQLKGTIKQIQWLNPHSWIYLEVAGEDGRATVWALEGASVLELQRRGWTKENIKAGDKISVRCHRLRDGSRGCLLGFVTTADGVEKLFD